MGTRTPTLLPKSALEYFVPGTLEIQPTEKTPPGPPMGAFSFFFVLVWI
jgi:hypothetical protein